MWAQPDTVSAASRRSNDLFMRVELPNDQAEPPGGQKPEPRKRNRSANPAWLPAHRYTAPGVDSSRAAFRNNNADTTNNMALNTFPPNPRNTAAVHGVT